MSNRTTTLGKLVTAIAVVVASLLGGALIGLLTLWWPASTTVTGTAFAAAAPEPPAPRQEAKPRKKTTPVVYGQRPGTIRLPQGGTATLIRQEVGPDAVLPVPDNLDEATWWGAGLDAPEGASLLAGHVNWQGKVGPFAELWNTQVGQRVTVKDEQGRNWTYRVSQVITLDKDELPSRAEALFGQEGKHRLVLVTCGGRWIGGDTGYASNRVVIAEPADQGR